LIIGQEKKLPNYFFGLSERRRLDRLRTLDSDKLARTGHWGLQVEKRKQNKNKIYLTSGFLLIVI